MGLHHDFREGRSNFSEPVSCVKPRSMLTILEAYSQILPEGWRSLVERTGLENQSALLGTGGSNPSPSAYT